MNSLVNHIEASSLPLLSYGYIVKDQVVRWIFWEQDPLRGSRKVCMEINSKSSRLNLVDSDEKVSISLKNIPSFYKALGVDWLTKAMPNPQLFVDKQIFEQVALRRITNPTDLATFILGDDLAQKVPPKLFFRCVLTNPYFDSWDKVKIAILLLMVSDNTQKSLERIATLSQHFNTNYPYFRLVNLCFEKGVILDCSISSSKILKCIDILDKDEEFLYRDNCFVVLDGSFSSCFDLVRQYSNYASRAITIAEFDQKQEKTIYNGSLQLPEGITLIDTPEKLVAEGRKMSHCVGSYVPKLINKKSFFLHVKFEKVSATVEIVRNTKKKCFEIKQIKGVANNAVPATVVGWVKRTISSLDAQYFFFKNYYKRRKPSAKNQQDPTLFDTCLTAY